MLRENHMGDLDGHGYRKSCGGGDRGWKQWWSLNQSHTFFFFFLFLFLFEFFLTTLCIIAIK
jgi:hypothetical protein